MWIAFFTYWGIASRNAARTQGAESWRSTAVHQVLLSSALCLLLIPVPGLTGRFVPSGWFWWSFGVALQAAFACLAIWARIHLGRNWSAEVRIAEGHQLVRSGPYRTVRHPIYSAMLGMFVGTALTSGQVHALVGLALLTLAYRRKTRLEEQILRENFGAQFESYRQVTWALVPGLY